MGDFATVAKLSMLAAHECVGVKKAVGAAAIISGTCA